MEHNYKKIRVFVGPPSHHLIETAAGYSLEDETPLVEITAKRCEGKDLYYDYAINQVRYHPEAEILDIVALYKNKAELDKYLALFGDVEVEYFVIRESKVSSYAMLNNSDFTTHDLNYYWENSVLTEEVMRGPHTLIDTPEPKLSFVLAQKLREKFGADARSYLACNGEQVNAINGPQELFNVNMWSYCDDEQETVSGETAKPIFNHEMFVYLVNQIQPGLNYEQMYELRRNLVTISGSECDYYESYDYTYLRFDIETMKQKIWEVLYGKQ